MTKVKPNNGNETKLDIFYGTYSNLTSFFIDHKILTYFDNFHNWYLSISLQKLAQTKETKKHETCANLTVFFLIYNVTHYLNDFENLFLDKVYLKNE